MIRGRWGSNSRCAFAYCSQGTVSVMPTEAKNFLQSVGLAAASGALATGASFSAASAAAAGHRDCRVLALQPASSRPARPWPPSPSRSWQPWRPSPACPASRPWRPSPTWRRARLLAMRFFEARTARSGAGAVAVRLVIETGRRCVVWWAAHDLRHVLTRDASLGSRATAAWPAAIRAVAVARKVRVTVSSPVVGRGVCLWGRSCRDGANRAVPDGTSRQEMKKTAKITRKINRLLEIGNGASSTVPLGPPAR